MIEGETLAGLTNHQYGANGLLLQADCIGNPNSFCLEATTYALNCILLQRDITSNFVLVVWKNTGTVAVPVWTVTTSTNVISGQGATRTLLANESGSIALFDRAAGIVYTLPAPVVGLSFTFVTTVAITSNAAAVESDAETTFLVGTLINSIAGATDGATTPFLSVADGSTKDGISSNGTTTGGLIGGVYTLTCINATQWAVNGVVVGSGALASPFNA